ncbi:hypothetical protein [Sedimentitalea sp.]|uniref:hypothetical protein n=1 Tax=Sedimentitalea sp. TaxID=2048915 RepID=UPI0032992768
MMVTNQEYSVVQATAADVASQPDGTFSTNPNQHHETCHCVFLEQVKVVDGVCHKQSISAVNDLIAGDQYRFPVLNQHNQSNISVQGETATIEFSMVVEVGTAVVRARRTHCITLMSDQGHILPADVLTTSENRVLLALRDTVMRHQDYALISMVPTHAR